MALSQHGSIQNLLGHSMSSINTTQQDLLLANFNLPGMRIDGRMSAVRRFFCLFVTFDLLFTALFWIICVLINGQSIVEGLDKEILNYTFQTSMFDLVICSLFRFSLLLIFYAIIYIQGVWVVAVTTLISSAFLVSKSLLFQWNSGEHSTTNYPFQVLLLLIAFLMAWAEAWFVDFSVLPQEERATKLINLQSHASAETMGNTNIQSRLRDYLSQCGTESVANFYSPLQSPYESEDEEQEVKKLSPMETKWLGLGIDSVLRAFDLMNYGGWQIFFRPNELDAIHTTKVNGKKIFKISGPLPIAAESVFMDCVLNIETMPNWNRAIAHVRKVQTITTSCDIVHQISANVPGGVISSRDFVTCRHWRKFIGGESDNWSVCYITGGMSVEHPDCPVNKSYTRGENGPGCWAFYSLRNNQTLFQWIFDTDLKGWLPKSVVEANISSVMCEQLQFLRSHCESLSAQSVCLPSSVEQSFSCSLDTSTANNERLMSVSVDNRAMTQPSGSSVSSILDTTSNSLPPVTFRDCHETS